MLGNLEPHKERLGVYLPDFHRSSLLQMSGLYLAQPLPEGTCRLVLAHLLRAQGRHAEADVESFNHGCTNSKE